MTDVYDGKIWQSFPSQIDDLESRFFTKEAADSTSYTVQNAQKFLPKLPIHL